MKFSLVVSTIGRVDELGALLASLAAQSFREFEVIVVDQSGDDRLAAVINRFRSVLSLQHVPMRERGASRGRNRGLLLATGEIVAFPDDDCTYGPAVLARVKQIFETQHDIDALCVRSEDPSGAVQKIARFDARAGAVTRANLLNCFVEFTFFSRREQFAGLSFNETLGVGAGTPWGADEGPDLVLRMLGRGCRMQYVPEIIIWHPSPLETLDDKVFSRSYAYGCGRGRLFRLHRYGPHVVAGSLARSMTGCCLNLLRLRVDWARYYWLAFRGKLRGYLSNV